MAAEQDVTTRELWRLTATELAARFARNAATPVDYLDVLLARIERLNPRINALIAFNTQARAEALESTARLREGRVRGPLEGIPVAIKDNILVKGMPTTWGSRAFRDAVSAEDELPVRRLREAGAVILGKTNVPEFTLEGYTGNSLFGTTRNPWNVALTPGGSSGGSVAGVAAGLFPLALGTDGGGSIRRPASHTGLVGLKPSIAVVPRFPTLPQILLDFEVIGPIARTVEDAALLFSAIAGPGMGDRPGLATRVSRVSLDAPPPLRILYVRTIDDNALDPEIDASVSSAVQTLVGLGHHVEFGPLPFDLAAIVEFWPILGQVGLAYVFAQHPEAEQLAAARFVEMAQAGRGIGASRYLGGIETVRIFRHDVAAAFESFDLIVTPSAAALPWPANEFFPPTIAGRPVGPRGHAVYTGWVNACGHPAISMPCAPASNGLPIGFQLVGRHGDDELLFRIAAQYQAAQPFADRWPALAHNG
jgi:aspartyl-tRNA(Asn)/glutamyl-tRNA(Gln) amidotransferase subunit A